MPVTTVMHKESWTMEIHPGEGETWPAIQAYSTGPMIRPDQIIVYLTAGHRSQDVKVFGFRLKRDGEPSKSRSQSHLFGTVPDWIAEIIEHERTVSNLGEGTVCPAAS